MADSPRRRYSRSPPPLERPRSRSRSRDRSRSRSRSPNGNDALNPGNTLYVTGLSSRVTERDLEDHFSKEGKSRRKRPRTPTPGNYLGAKSTRETGYRGDRGRYRGGGGGYGRDEYRRSPRRSPPYRGGRDYSPPRRSPYGGRHYSPPPRRSPYGGGRSRRERSRSYGGPERGYGRRPDVYSR